MSREMLGLLRGWFLLWLGLVLVSAGQAASGEDVYGPRLGTAVPGRYALFERAVQLHIVANGPFHVEAAPPLYFSDAADPTRTLPARFLEWRVAGVSSAWQPMTPGEPVSVWIHSGEGHTEHLVELDYRLSVPWDVPPSVGGYVLEVPYYAVGEAVLRAGTVWPSRVSSGERVTVMCVRASAVLEDLHFVVYDAAGDVVAETKQAATVVEPRITIHWTALLPAGEYAFRLTGSETGLCAAGRIAVTDTSEAEPLRTAAGQVAEAEKRGFTLGVTLHSGEAIGEWLWLTVRVANQSPFPGEGLRLAVRLPRGLRTVGDVYVLDVPPLHPSEHWEADVPILVTPAARAGVVEVALLDPDTYGAEVEMAVERISFVPHVDGWLQPAVRVQGAGLQTQVQQGWHVLWQTGVPDESSRPRLLDVRGAAPLLLGGEVRRSQVTAPGVLRATLGLVADDEGFRTRWESSTDLQFGSLRLASRLTRDDDGESYGRWQIRASGPALPDLRGEWTGTLVGNWTGFSGLQLGWRKDADDGLGRITISYRYDTTGTPRSEIRLENEDTTGGLTLRRRLGTGSDAEIALWRTTGSGRLVLRAGWGIDGAESLRLGGGYEGTFLGGRIELGTAWHPAAQNVASRAAFRLHWAGDEPKGLSPFAGLSGSTDGVRARVGLVARRPAGEDVVAVQLGAGQAGLGMTWRSRWQEGDAIGRLSLSVQPERTEARLAVRLQPFGVWLWEAEASVQADRGTERTEAVVTLSGGRLSVRWSSSLEATAKVLQIDRRIDVRTEIRIIGLPSRAGVLAGSRTVRSALKTPGPLSSRTAFYGGWMEIEAVSRTWAGVALAKWNTEQGAEYDVYLRHEVAPALWIQVGVHRAPGVLTLFPDHGRGTYARLLWAVSFGG